MQSEDFKSLSVPSRAPLIRLLLIGGCFHRHIAIFVHWGIFVVAFLFTRSLQAMGLSIDIGRGSCRECARRSTEDRLLEVCCDWGWRSFNWRNVCAAKFGNDIRGSFGVNDFLDINWNERGFCDDRGTLTTYHLFPEEFESL